jgi:hypothetical protein
MDESLLNQLECGNAQQRRAASFKMGKSKDASYIPCLIRAYNDPDPSVRRNVLDGLRRIGSDEAGEFLDAVEAERQSIVTGHGGAPLEPLSPRVKELLDNLRTGLADSREKAAQELGQLTKSGEAVFLALMAAKGTDRVHSVREAADEALRAPVHQAMLQDRPDLDLDLGVGPVAVFRPLSSIRWPRYCVRCVAPNPSDGVTLSVSGATKASKGALAGGLVGGLAGALVGAAVGGAAASSETSAYSVPVCEACRSRLSGRDVSGLRGDKDGIVSADIETPLLSRRLSKGCVVLTFRNATYAAAFHKANEGNIFDSVEACRIGAKTIDIDPDQLESLDIGSESFDQLLLDLLKSYVPLNGLFVEPDIPAKKLANATQNCDISEEERVLALVDCTVLGSAKNCLLFGSKAVYYHNDRASKSSGAGTIPYDELASRVVTAGGFGELSLGQDQYLNVSGCPIPREKMLGIVMSVQRLLAQGMPDADDDHESFDAGSEGLEQAILDLLKSFAALDGLFVEPDIPAKKLSNARRSCGLPEKSRILALVDCTLLGSAKSCLLFGPEAIHYHNDWSSKSPGAGKIPYSELASRAFAASRLEVSLGQNQYLNVSGCSVPNDKLLEILTSTKRLIA